MSNARVRNGEVTGPPRAQLAPGRLIDAEKASRLGAAQQLIPLFLCRWLPADGAGLNRIFTRRTKTAPGIRAAIHCLSPFAGFTEPSGLRCTLSNTRMRQ